MSKQRNWNAIYLLALTPENCHHNFFYISILCMFFGSILAKFHLLLFFWWGGGGGYVKIYNEFAKQSKIKIENNYVNWVIKVHIHMWGHFNTTEAFCAIKDFPWQIALHIMDPTQNGCWINILKFKLKLAWLASFVSTKFKNTLSQARLIRLILIQTK